VKATVLVRPKPGILDPQGQAVESSLRHLGFAVAEARVGKLVELVGEERFDEVELISLELYRFVSEQAAARGIILADTKLEFGLDGRERLVLADEAFTPDSSRFWPSDEYVPGGPQPSFDKQFARDYCESLGWNKACPGPELPEDVVSGTRARYVEAFERLTGVAFDEYVRAPDVVLR